MLEELKYKSLAKFKVLTEPLQIPPMKCMGCGRFSSGDPNKPLHFVDMGFDIEFHGEAFLCVEGCFREIMNQLGVLTKEQTLKFEAELNETRAMNKELKTKNKELQRAVGSLNRAVTVGAASIHPVAVAARQESEPVVPPKSDQGSSGTEQGSTEQTNERGSTGVSNSQGDDLFDAI